MSSRNLDCPVPEEFGSPCHLPAGATILQRAAYASDAANRYQAAMNARADFRTILRLSGALARATHELTTAIADAVACGNSSLTE